MSEVQSEKPKSGALKYVLFAVIAVGVAVFLYVIAGALIKPSQPQSITSFRKGTLAMLEVPGASKPRNPRFPDLDQGMSPAAAPAPDLAIEGPDGKPIKFADFKGKVLVVNMWATWCAPCKEEMPTLGQLSAAYATQPLAVVAISTDSPDTTKYPGDTMDTAIARAKLELAKSPPLQFYHSPGLDVTFKFNPPAAGLPTTVIYDKDGVERGRLSGGANWNSPEARALIEELLKA
jgi:thiol-disulfide isomerase/thioredoxin